jgi:biotin--protein ligase
MMHLRDASYLVQLPLGWEPERMDAEQDEQMERVQTAFSVKSYFRKLDQLRLDKAQPSWLGRTLIHASVLTSTQDLLRSFAFPDGTVVVADRQVSGRGRRGSSWSSPSGSLAFTVQCDLEGAVARPLQFVQYIAGLALVESIPDEDAEAQRAAERVLRIKWPNDLYADGLKVAGILCESSLFQDRCTLYVGIGVNVANAAPTVALTRFPWAAGLSRETLLARFLVAFEQYLRLFLKQGWQASGLGDRYTARWLHHDQQVFLEDAKQHGCIIGLSDQGRLLVRMNSPNGSPTLSPRVMEQVSEGDALTRLIEIDPDVSSFDWQQGIVRRKR